jgi:hypothetical protein
MRFGWWYNRAGAGILSLFWANSAPCRLRRPYLARFAARIPLAFPASKLGQGLKEKSPDLAIDTCASVIVPVDHGRAPAIRTVAGAVRPGFLRNPHTMKKVLALALASLAALALNMGSASAGWFCHHCNFKVNACATQYNAFSPFCVSGVYSSKHCHKCNYPAEGPCCNPGWGGPCWGGVCGGPACSVGGDAATLGVLPAPTGTATIQNGRVLTPLAPAPVPSIPGATSQFSAPSNLVQPTMY